MVKVISAYNFQEQNTYSTSGDIVAVCLIGSNQLAVAHNNHLVEILILNRRLDGKDSVSFDRNNAQRIAFPTVDQVEQLLHCKCGNFLVTLEKKLERSGDNHKRYVRVYTNFQIANAKNCFSTPIRARIASKITPKNSTNEYIEVVELPINGVPDLVACCQMSGTIAIGCGSNIYFYEFINRYNDFYKFTFIDFIEFPFHVRLEFTPLKLAIAEHVVACFDESRAVAFKIVDLNDVNTESGSPSNSMVTDSSLHAAMYKLTEPIDFDVAKQFNQVDGHELATDVRSNWDSNNDSRLNISEERPITVGDIKVSIESNLNNNNENVSYATRTLLQLRMPQAKNVGLLHDKFRCLTLKPIYYNLNRFGPTDICSHKHLMKSNYHTQCIGFSLFISTVSDGYLYQFTNQGKWYSEDTKCLTTYPFTAPVIDVIVDNYVIHAITENGIETFSSRVGHKLFSSYYEYPMMSDAYPKETSPLVDVPICVMGICGFFGIKFVAASDKNLVLLTTYDEKSTTNYNSQNKNDKYDCDWTIYDLQFAKPEILVNDIKHLANIYRSTKPDVYYELMEEAHVIIRLAREIVYDYDTNLKEIIDSSFHETCQQLADFTIASERKEVYSQAVAYYAMSKQSVWEVYLKYKELEQLQDEGNVQIKSYDGLIYTLKIMLSTLCSKKSETDYLTQSVKSNGKDNNETTIADELLSLFVNHAPNEIATIGLKSLVFREILNEPLIKLFTDKKNLNSDEKLCLVVCLCHSNNLNDAINVFEKMSRKELHETLKEHWIVLFDNFQPDNYRKSYFSDLTENILFVTEKEHLIEALSDVFIHILVETRSIDLDFVLKLFMNYFAAHLGHKGYRTSQKILEILLRAYFYDFFNHNLGRNSDISSHNSDIILSQSRSNLIYANGASNKIKNSISNADSSSHSKMLDESPTIATTVDSNYEDPEFEAMKILFRMYLGLLKQYTLIQAQHTKAPQPEETLPDVMGYRLAFIDYMVRNSKIVKTAHAKFDNNVFNTEMISLLPNYNELDEGQLKTFRRPIIFFERRESFLNKMKPLTENSFKADCDNVLYFDDWDNEVNVVLIKIQAILSSGKLNNSLIDDFIAFIHSNPNIIGIDSLLTILLPKSEGVEFLVHVNPIYLLDYAKSRFTTPIQWQVLFRRLLSKKRELSSESKTECVEYYDKIIQTILRELVADKNLEDFLACIPEQEIYCFDEDREHNGKEKYSTCGDGRACAPDNVDETNPFELIMREAVGKQRSDALCSMLQSTGRQLYDAVNHCQLNLN